jgi:hypothetical protein
MGAAFLGPAPHTRNPGGRFPDQPRQFANQPHVVAGSRPQQIRARERPISRSQHRDVHRLRRLQRPGHLVGGRDAVGQHMVNLVDDRDPVLGQPLDDVHLPQRPAAVQRGARNLADQLVKLASATRSGHPRLAQVIVEVNVGALNPHGVMQLQRDVHQLKSKRCQRHEPWIGDFAKQLETESALHAGYVEHADLEGVHMDLGCFAVEHQGVHAVEPLHIPPRSSTPARAIPHWTSCEPSSSAFGETDETFVCAARLINRMLPGLRRGPAVLATRVRRCVPGGSQPVRIRGAR